MTDEVWKRREIASPCVKICLIHPDAGICVGCLRTRDEIAMWSQYSDDDRLALMEALPGRRHALAQRKGGRAARLKREF